MRSDCKNLRGGSLGKREDILEAAMDILAEGGARALTLPALFERAKTGSGTFYHYFDGRDDLIDAVFAHSVNIASRELSALDNPELKPHERYYEFWKNLFRAYREYPRELDFLYWFTYGYVVSYDPDREEIPSIQVLNSIISAAQERGCIHDNDSANTMSHWVRGMFASLFWANKYDEFEMTDENALRFAEDTWRMMNVCQIWVDNDGASKACCD